ncbi:IS5 family transposase [Paenibacillus tyrfis]|uniref:IS5 family transposase n=1 Tax=Paenibacillus tyrfis TaxID=1501230 RepID=UPI000B59293C
MGRSRGGLTSKIHVVVDALGYPLRFELTAGQQHDSVSGYALLQNLELTGRTVIADRGYDMNKILELIENQKAIAVIPSRRHRKVQRSCDWWLYKERHLVELLFNRLKHYRRIATRYDKLACTFMARSTSYVILRIRRVGATKYRAGFAATPQANPPSLPDGRRV